MAKRTKKPSNESLESVLAEKGAAARAIRKRFRRQTLWRYIKAKVKPRMENAEELSRLSGGRVPVDGWRDAV